MHHVETLESSLRSLLPGLRFVKDLHLRRMRSELADRGERFANSPELPLWCDRDAAIESRILPEETTRGEEPRLCLLPIPQDPEPGRHILVRYWKAVYSARLMEALRELGEPRLAQAWNSLDGELRHEAAFVVLRDHRVPIDDPTPAENFAGFALEFLTLWRFSPSLVRRVFPAVGDGAGLAGRLAEGIDEPALFASSRPVGAPSPTDVRVLEHPEWKKAPPPAPRNRAEAQAAGALRRGNAVRAAIAWTQGGDPGQADAAIAERLTPLLAKVFDWDAARQAEWASALAAVVRAAAEHGWPPAAKFLYDLQTIAKDLAQELYAVDPAGWLQSLGRRPLLRKLTLQRQSILLVKLHRADKHLGQSTLAEGDRERIEELLGREIERAEGRLRETLEPLFLKAFRDAGLVPGTVVEALARDKVVAELLDHACERGHIRLGDLRDALARNSFKMPDLAGPVELLAGDALLRADAMLARELDGIYHRGEFYLRWFQRGSAAAFGTRPGRFLTLFALIPFMAAFMTVAFAQYLEHEAKGIAAWISRLIQSHDPAVEYVAGINEQGEWDWIAEPITHPENAIEITAAAWISIGILSALNLLLVNVPAFRRAAFSLLKLLGRFLHFLVFRLPRLLWHSRIARLVRRNRLARVLTRWLLVPILFGGLAAGFVALFGGSTTLIQRYFLGVFGTLAILMATRFGQLLRDGTEEAASDAWINLRYNVIPGMVAAVAWFFREVLGRFQSLLYTIDEWFRYREGQSKPNLALKTLAGIAWFPIAYVFRFAIFLLVEPQINPIKHFPTVTVSHKLLLPMIPSVAAAANVSAGLVTFIFTCIPGIFGFLVWELKENWKLYGANRKPNLGPSQLGHHGETMRGLLRPGFHSGTIPKDFRKIRQAILKAETTGSNPMAPKPLASLHAVEHALHLFIDRELVALLRNCRSWRGLFPIHTHVHLGVQAVRIEFGISSPDHEHPAAETIRFRHDDGVIHGDVTNHGFTRSLNPDQRRDWETAVRGLFARAAVTGEHECVEWSDWVAYWERAAV
jgi:hypothetical protein